MSTRLERLLTMEEEIRRGRYPNVDTFCEMFEVTLCVEFPCVYQRPFRA